MAAEGHPTYVAVCRATMRMAIVNLPVVLNPYAGRLIERLTLEFFGESVNDDLIFSMNWHARQWVVQALDDYELWEICE